MDHYDPLDPVPVPVRSGPSAARSPPVSGPADGGGRLSWLLEGSRTAYLVVDASGCVSDFSLALADLLGVPAPSLVGAPAAALFASDAEAHAIEARWVAALQSPAPSAFECELMAGVPARALRARCLATGRDGSAKPELHIVLEPVAHRDGNLAARTAALLQDALLQSVDFAVIATNASGLVTLMNPAAERMVGYRAEEVIGVHTPALWLDADASEARARVEASVLAHAQTAGASVPDRQSCDAHVGRHRLVVRHRDGRRMVVHVTTTALRGAGGALEGFLETMISLEAEQQRERALTATRHQLEKAVEVAGLGIWTWSLADDSLVWNRRMFELYAYPESLAAEGVRYEHWRSRLHPDDLEATELSLKNAVAGIGVYDPVFRILLPDGGVRHIQAAAVIEFDESGSAIQVTGINRDVSLEREAARALESSRLAAEQASATKSEFVANVSHEIRTPMNAILGMLRLLESTPLAPRQADYVGKAYAAGRSLLALLNDILDFSRIESGKLQLDLQPFGLEQLVDDVGVIMSSAVGDKPLEVVIKLDPSAPQRLVGDSTRLRQVLLNLSSNAVKFTAEGTVSLEVQLVRRDADLAWLRFSVRDTGLGIAEDHLEQIFESFTQAESSITRRFGGSGLGLAISRRLVHLMGGEMGVCSRLGEGSEFHFSVPLRPILDPLPQRPALASLGRCLVIDDHPECRAILAEMLNSLGAQVETAASGDEVLSRLAAQSSLVHYGLVLVDWQMPGVDGWETARQLRRLLGPDSSTVILMVTAHSREAVASRQIERPDVLDAVLTKPVTASTLMDALATRGGTRHVVEAIAARGPRQCRLPGKRILLAEDNAINQQVACELLEMEGACVTAVADGAAAVAALATRREDFDLVLMDVHMPVMDGYEATRRIRQLPGGKTIPIVAMTANAMSLHRREALASGMDDHLTKPIDIDAVVAIATALFTAEPRRQAETAAPHVAALLDVPGTLRRMAGNHALLVGALGRFLAKWSDPAVQRTVSGGAAPADRAAALHGLRGLAGTLGANALAEAAGELELAIADAVGHPPLGGFEERFRRCLDATLAAIREFLAANSEAGLPVTTGGAQEHDSPATAEPARWIAEATKLDVALASCSLDAFAILATLQPGVPAAQQSHWTGLREALDRLDFAAARRELARLMAAPA